MDILIEMKKSFWDNFNSELYKKYLQAKLNNNEKTKKPNSGSPLLTYYPKINHS